MKVDDNELKIVQQILHKNLPEYSVWAFGSRVHGRQLKPFSDLDLAIITTVPLTPERYQALLDAFNDSNLPFKVDVVDWARISASFQSIILEQYEVIQK